MANPSTAVAGSSGSPPRPCGSTTPKRSGDCPTRDSVGPPLRQAPLALHGRRLPCGSSGNYHSGGGTLPDVLLIEGDEDTRAALAEVLVEHGYTPLPVPTVRQAIEHLTVSQPPCMVVLDVDPRGEAVEFLRWLHGNEQLRG